MTLAYSPWSQLRTSGELTSRELSSLRKRRALTTQRQWLDGVLDPRGSVLYSGLRFVTADTLKGSQERVVKPYSSYFAFTYRFPLWRKRAGETRAGDLID